MHDIQASTARAMPTLLAELKARGYKVVHIRPKADVQTMAEYDAKALQLAERKVAGGSPLAKRALTWPATVLTQSPDQAPPRPIGDTQRHDADRAVAEHVIVIDDAFGGRHGHLRQVGVSGDEFAVRARDDKTHAALLARLEHVDRDLEVAMRVHSDQHGNRVVSLGVWRKVSGPIDSDAVSPGDSIPNSMTSRGTP